MTQHATLAIIDEVFRVMIISRDCWLWDAGRIVAGAFIRMAVITSWCVRLPRGATRIVYMTATMMVDVMLV